MMVARGRTVLPYHPDAEGRLVRNQQNYYKNQKTYELFCFLPYYERNLGFAPFCPAAGHDCLTRKFKA